jgi:anamorsin
METDLKHSYLASSPVFSGSSISEKVPETVSNNAPSTPPPPSMALPKRTTKSAKQTIWAWAINLPASVSRIDPTTLLEPSDLVRPSPTTSVACAPNAGTKKKRACAGCTCGLAEREKEEMQREAEQLMDPERMRLTAAVRAANKMTPGMNTSSCGSCYMGDAFRCSGCPYLG